MNSFVDSIAFKIAHQLSPSTKELRLHFPEDYL